MLVDGHGGDGGFVVGVDTAQSSEVTDAGSLRCGGSAGARSLSGFVGIDGECRFYDLGEMYVDGTCASQPVRRQAGAESLVNFDRVVDVLARVLPDEIASSDGSVKRFGCGEHVAVVFAGDGDEKSVEALGSVPVVRVAAFPM